MKKTKNAPETETALAPSRRGFIKSGLLGSAGVLGTLTLLSQTARSAAQNPVRAEDLVCRLTPPQTKGPFYPIHDQLDKDNDLTNVQGSALKSKGQVIYVMGQVTGPDCKPVEGVLVEIWQACDSGRYNHDNDPNPAPLDPNFQYFGRNVTDAQGRYVFKTILPGAYPADKTWWRPPHIHFRVLKRGFTELITQLYFAGQALNDKDLILQDLSPEDRDAVVVPLLPAPSDQFEPFSQVATFDLVLKKPGAPARP